MSTSFNYGDMYSHAGNKRKLDFTSDDIIWHDFPEFPPPKKRKKKKSKKKKDPNSKDNDESPQNSFSNDNFQMSNGFNITVINAKPEDLPSTPKIFKKEQSSSPKKLPDLSNPFYLNRISEKSFSSNITDRFINFIKAGDQNGDKQSNIGSDSKKKSKNKSKKKVNPALEKLRQEIAQSSKKKRPIKRKDEELFDKGLKSIECARNEENHWNEVYSRSVGNQDFGMGPRYEGNRMYEMAPWHEENQRNGVAPRSVENQRYEMTLRDEENRRNEINLINEESPRNKYIPTSTAPVEKSYKVDMYESCVKETVIFHLHYPCEFSFYGEVKITVIAGQIEILGCTVNESTLKTVDVYSPNFYVPWIIECKELKQSDDTEKVRNKIQHLLKIQDVDKLLNNLKCNDVILLIEQIKSTIGGVIDLYFHKSLFRKDLVDFSSNSESLKSLQSTFNFRLNNEGVRRNPQWDGIPSAHCTVICGGQGVGKSTLLKYFVNKALTQNQKVLCLDFDPGQPEFTPSGCLSAVIVDKPLLGPNFSHMIDPEIMVYFGSTDVSYSPNLYMKCVNYVIEKCREKEEFSNLAWFVNTMGFNRGVGVELMTAIIKLTRPDVVVQIRSPDMKKNYPCYFTPRHVNSKKNSWSILNENVELSYDLRVVDSFVRRGKKSFQGSLTAKNLRDILFFSYFSKMVSPSSYSFNSVKPYLRSFSNLYLGIESLISPNEILKAFNGSVVALSHFEHDSEEIFVTEPEVEDYFKIVVKPAISLSFGLGLIRGINVEEKKFYVLTHLSNEKLSQVNCLNLGRIHTPYSIFLIQEDVEGQLPYTCLSTIDSVQKVNRLIPQPVSGTDDEPPSDGEGDENRQNPTMVLLNGLSTLINNATLTLTGNSSRESSESPEPDEPTFDRTLAAKHEYLGRDLEDVRGRTVHDEGSIVWLPIMMELEVVLVPGQTLPLTAFYPPTIAMLREIIAKDRTFGVVCVNSLTNFGTTAEIFQYQESSDLPGFKIKAKGRQRFKLLDQSRQTPEVLLGKVLILPELNLGSPLNSSRFVSLDKYRCNLKMKQKLLLLDASPTPWPSWVYKQYDANVLVKKVMSELKYFKNDVITSSPPTDPIDLSYWVAQCLPIDGANRVKLLSFDSAIERLQYALSILSECQKFYCSHCGNYIADRKDVFSMSIDGPQGMYCNPGGYVHEIVTVYKGIGMNLDNRSYSTEYSWFPGYGWTIAQCSFCNRHMGWLFTATNSSLKPSEFWGLSRKSVSTYRKELRR